MQDLCSRLATDYQIASRQPLPSVISPRAVGSSHRTALPQEFNLIGNLRREQILLLFSYASSNRPVTIPRLA